MHNSLYRIKHLLYRDFKEVGMSLLIIFPMLLAVSFGAFALDFGIFTMIMGFVLPAMLYPFLSFMDNEKSTHYLLIPANTAEKLFSTLIVNSILYSLMAFFACLLAAICIQWMSALPIAMVFDANNPLWDSFSVEIILLLCLFQALLIALIIKFNNKGVNVVVGIALIYFAIQIIFYVISRLFGIFQYSHLAALADFEWHFQGILYQEISYIVNLALILLTILLWVASYFSLREKELK